MNVLFIHLLMLSPVLLEAAFDHYMWSKGKSDKPVSTFVVRPILMVTVVLLITFVVDIEREWWRVSLVVLSYHFLFFGYLINWIRGEVFFYLSNDNAYDRFLKKIGHWPRLWLQVWVAIVCVCIYYFDELWYSTYDYLYKFIN